MRDLTVGDLLDKLSGFPRDLPVGLVECDDQCEEYSLRPMGDWTEIYAKAATKGSVFVEEGQTYLVIDPRAFPEEEVRNL